jgi:hypothetical protein
LLRPNSTTYVTNIKRLFLIPSYGYPSVFILV